MVAIDLKGHRLPNRGFKPPIMKQEKFDKNVECASMSGERGV